MRQSLLIVIVACFGGFAHAADRVVIHSLEGHTNEFGGREISRRFRIETDRPLVGRFVWSVSAQERTIDRGEQEVRVTEAADSVSIKFRVNALRDEVVVPLTLAVAVVVEQTEIAAKQHQLWLFPDDPFSSRGEWLSSLDITLFDPAEKTAEEFDNAKIPYQLVRNAAALNNLEHRGMLIIGEGVSLRQHKSLAETAMQAAASGRRVVLLAPADGSVSVPGTAGDGLPDGGIPSELRFARQHVITELDKRLDARAWPGTNNTVPSSRFLIESHRSRVEATLSDDSRAWPWLEVHFPESNGVLVICGFRIIENWNKGPTPRFLLLRLLESVLPNS